MIAMESHSCRGYRSKTRSVPRPQESSEARPRSSQLRGLPPSACGSFHAIVAPVGDWEGPAVVLGGISEATAQNDKSIAYSCLGPAAGLDVA